GVNGILTSPLGDDDDEANAVAIQADGRIVVAGYTDGDGVDFAVLRYEPGGTLDPGFAVGGIAITDVSGPYDQAEDVVIQADGAILVGGYTYNGTDGDFGLVRYTANGELDPSFGDAGIVRTSIADGSHDAGTCLAVQPDARIVMAGHTDAIPYQATAVVRYLSGLNLGSLETNSTASEVLVYPLPVVDEAVLEYELARASMLSCSLLDAQGRTARVFSSRTSRAAGRHAERLDLSGLVAGPYTLLIDGTSGKSTVRLVKR
ncbi:MAG: hypothetical protein JNM91_08155, partial [Flavobacteriales bacterium]|nr:hypothetical protein [Flavobacteriales bacterium]